MKNIINEFASFYLSMSNNTFIDFDTKNDMNFIVERYSSAKYGSIKDINFFSKMMAKTIFDEIDDSKSNFREMLNIAKKNNDFIVLMTPGYRNVKSFANVMFDIALPCINVKLSTMEFPIIAKLKLPRLVNPTKNYASLTFQEREDVAFITDHILPDDNFYKGKNIHVIYGDDVLITGSSSNKANEDSISKGAKSFTTIYSVIMDSQIALKNPKIEEKLNLSKITGNLDKTAQEIFIQNDFIPVLKSLELILDRKNLNDLEGFIHNIPINNVLKVYVSYMTNESLKNEDYQQSLKIIQKYLIEQKIIDIDGLLKFND